MPCGHTPRQRRSLGCRPGCRPGGACLADRALLAALPAVIPRARRQGLRLLVTPDTVVRWHRDIVRRRWAARSARASTGRPAARRDIQALVRRLPRESRIRPANHHYHQAAGGGAGQLLNRLFERHRFPAQPIKRISGSSSSSTAYHSTSAKNVSAEMAHHNLLALAVTDELMRLRAPWSGLRDIRAPVRAEGRT